MKTEHSFHLFLDPEANRRLVSHFPDLISVKPVDAPPLVNRPPPDTRNSISLTWEQKARLQELRNELQALKSYRAKGRLMGLDMEDTDAKIFECRKKIAEMRAN